MGKINNKDILKLLALASICTVLISKLNKDVSKIKKPDLSNIDEKELYISINYKLGKDFKSGKEVTYKDLSFTINKTKNVLFNELLDVISDTNRINSKEPSEYREMIDAYTKELDEVLVKSKTNTKIKVEVSDINGILNLMKRSIDSEFKEYINETNKILESDIYEKYKAVVKSTYPMVNKYVLLLLSIQKELINMLGRAGIDISDYNKVVKKFNNKVRK